MRHQNNQYDYKAMTRLIMASGSNAGLTEDELTAALVKLRARLLHLKKNEVIARQGEPARLFGLILSGNLRMTIRSKSGKSYIMRVVRAGEFAGHTFLFQDNPVYPCDAVAYPECTVIALDIEAARIWEHEASATPFFHMIAGQLSRSVVVAWQHSFVFSQPSLYESVLSYLIIRSAEDNSIEVVLPGNLEDLADYLSCSRAALSREIASLCQNGVITRTGRGRFRLNNEHETTFPTQIVIAEPGCTSPDAVIKRRKNNKPKQSEHR